MVKSIGLIIGIGLVLVAGGLWVPAKATEAKPAAGRLASVTPVIKDWSSKGGTPRNKDSEQDLIYLVKPGDRITFSITTTKTCKHVWSARCGSKVLTSQTKQDVRQSNFTWQIPQKKANWDIEVKIHGRLQEIGLTPRKAHKTWSVTASALRAVRVGESIQKAIDSLPAEGGIVELAAGTYSLPQGGAIDIAVHANQKTRVTPVQVKRGDWKGKVTRNYGVLINERKNFTLRGAGMDKTILTNEGDGYDVLLVVKGSNLTIRDLSIGRSTGSIQWNSGCGIFVSGRNRDTAISNVRVERLRGFIHCSVALHLLKEYHAVENLTIRDCLSLRTRGGMGFVNLHNSTIANCEVSHTVSTHGIDLNQNCQHNTIEKSVVHNSVNAGIQSYTGSYKNLILHNILYANQQGIKITNGANHIDIRNNTCRGNKHAGIYLAVRFMPVNHITISNNRIYNNGYGVFVRANPAYPARLRRETSFDVTIESNTIFSNASGGIAHSINNYRIIVKNNIIANNRGYGIDHSRLPADMVKKYRGKRMFKGFAESEYIVSYNNVWGNRKGNYNNVSAGTGDISVNPLFANQGEGDFHLKSKTGWWDPKAKKWVKDNVHSPCIDAGDPKADCSQEPAPNGGRVNMGAYGNTAEASKSK